MPDYAWESVCVCVCVVCLADLFFLCDLKTLFLFFWLPWVFAAVCRLGLVALSGGYSGCGAQSGGSLWLLLLRRMGCRVLGLSCSARASLPHSMWDRPRPGIELVSPALAGRFLTTGPSGKSCLFRCENTYRRRHYWAGQNDAVDGSARTWSQGREGEVYPLPSPWPLPHLLFLQLVGESPSTQPWLVTQTPTEPDLIQPGEMPPDAPREGRVRGMREQTGTAGSRATQRAWSELPLCELPPHRARTSHKHIYASRAHSS